MSAKKPDHWADLMYQMFGVPLRRRGRAYHALNLAPGEFWLNASLKDHSFVTTLNRARKVAHIAQRSCTVWRRTVAGPQLQRVVAQGMCGQWIMQARHADWFRDDEPHCDRCVDVLGRLLNKEDAHEAVSA
jgi:hypothetical protein